MKYALVLAIGIAFGYWWGRDREPVVVEKVVERVVQEVIREKQPTLPPTECKLVVNEKPPESRTPKTFSNSERPGRQLTISSRTIIELEEDWDDLRTQIELQREDDGWRILKLESDSPFRKSGFVQGDLITDLAVESLRTKEWDRDNLPERFSRILDHVTR